MMRPAVFVALVALAAPASANDLSEEEFRLYCGYLDAVKDPAFAKLKGKAQTDKIAKKAKVKPKVLTDAVAKGQSVGDNCETIAAGIEKTLRAELDKAMAGRIHVFQLDASDPAHVVVAVSWLGIDKKKLLEEGALIAATAIKHAPMTKTIAVRAVDPSAADKDADAARWFEAKISGLNARRIDVPKIWEYAQTRYKRLFDGLIEG